MKLTFANDRVLAVMAHPDDAELLCAGTLARARADGAAIGICVMCQGDKGLASGRRVTDLGKVRRREAQAAAKVLGAQFFWFGERDGDLQDEPARRKKLIEIYRQFCPTLVLAHAIEDYHSDHRAAGALAEAASWFCASRGHVTKSPPCEVPPALWWCDTIDMCGFGPAFFIDVSEHVHLKQQMLAQHKSQLQRWQDDDFTPLTELMIRQCQARGAQANVPAAEAFRAHQAFKRLAAW